MSDVRSPSALAVILAILLPPLGVWIAEGIGFAFWVSLVLTLFAYLPGMVFALIAVLRPDLIARLRSA
jgi:uncharacterized membrane protein YqaE (UPF0057 family)